MPKAEINREQALILAALTECHGPVAIHYDYPDYTVISFENVERAELDKRGKLSIDQRVSL